MATGHVRIWEGAGGPWGRQRDRWKSLVAGRTTCSDG